MTTSVQENEVKENQTVTTIQRIYCDDIDDLIIRDPTNRRSFVNKSAYAKLHRSVSSETKRHSVGGLRGRFEELAKKEDEEIPNPEVFTPASFGYPKTSKLKPPLIKPKPLPPPRRTIQKPSKDVNSNEVQRGVESSDAEEINIILQSAPSQESVDKIANELSSFTMDGKPKKRIGSFRKLFLGTLFTKDKKKKNEEKNRSLVYTDNIQNETNFNKLEETPKYKDENKDVTDLDRNYAQFHINKFNSIRQNFNEHNYRIIENNQKSTTDFNTSPVKYIDTSSSTSVESEQLKLNRDTPPRAQETYQNIQVVNPKSTNSIERYRNLKDEEMKHNRLQQEFLKQQQIAREQSQMVEHKREIEDPQTIERNLNKSDTKNYPEKPTFPENPNNRINDPEGKPPRPKLSIEKLKLPPNREIYEPQPRVKSPIPTNRISTDKIIATELLKSTTRSPTPTRRMVQSSKPQINEKIITNVQVHAPQRAATPVDRLETATPVDLRKSVSMKMSPQKQDVRKSVEEYYWKQLKKLKDEEDSKLYNIYMNGYYEEQARLKRSRSLSPNSQRARRSLSLPRERNYELVRIPQQSIPEDQALTTTDGRPKIYNQNFIRNNPERRSADNLQRPIFRRGSLTKQEIYDTNSYNKRVSFSNSPSWSSRNGNYMQLPSRRHNSDLEDDVFYPEPTYSNRVLEQYRAQQLYGPIPAHMGDRRLSMDSLPRQDYIYGQNRVIIRRPISNVGQYDDYGKIQKYSSNTQLSPNGLYGSRQSIPDKQITVRNKFCDMYGQIHDSPQSGVVMGQMQRPPVPPRQTDGFTRGTRLTASAHDLQRRQLAYDPNNYENRPLPPLPHLRQQQISDTESSDASEIQRIMQKNRKKRGLFGK